MLPFVQMIPGCDLPFPLLEAVGGDGKVDEGLFFGGFSLPSYLLPLYQSTLRKARGGLLGELLSGAPSLCDGHY